jgi:hypothetical protein
VLFIFKLETRYYGRFGDDLVHLELTNDLVVARADNEGRVDIRVGVLEEDRFAEVSVRKVLLIDDVAGIVLDDQPEFLAGEVLIIYFENKAIIANALIGNRDLGFGDRGGLFAAAVCFAGQGATKEEQYCGKGNCDYFNCVVFRVRVHNILFLNFTKLILQKF